MIAIFKNNSYRLKKQLIVLQLAFTAIVSIGAIYNSNIRAQIWDVAVISEIPVDIDSKYVRVTHTNTTPRRSDLVSGKYDAILTVNPDGSHQLDSIKSQNTITKLIAALSGTESSTALVSNRAPGTNVLGYLIMFMLIMSLMCMSLYADDKMHGQLNRIVASPIKINTYLSAHCLFNFSFLFFPTIIILPLVKSISGINWGYNFFQLGSLTALICAFSTSFSLAIYSFLPNKDDSARITGNIIIILSSILAGSFYSFEEGNQVLEKIIQLLPQKAILTVANGVEQQLPMTTITPSLIYLIALTIVLYLISVIKMKHTVINKH